MKHAKKIALWVIAAELGFASFFVVSLFVPLPHHLSLKIVQSGSMEPAMPMGALVAVVPFESYGVGDIITFDTEARRAIPTTHRVVATERVDGSLMYRTKGDANEEADGALIPYGAVLGKVVVTVPRLGFVVDFARSKHGFLYMVVIPAALLVLDELINLYEAIRGLKRRPVRVRRKYTPAIVPEPRIRPAAARAAMDGVYAPYPTISYG